MRISDWSSDVCSSDLAEQIAEFTIAAAEQMNRLNLEPKVAMLSRSNFGSGSSASGSKMQKALAIVREHAPKLEIDGEMHGDCALDEIGSASCRERVCKYLLLRVVAGLLKKKQT